MRCTVFNKKRRTVALAVFLAILAVALMTAPIILGAYGVGGYTKLLRALGVLTLAASIYVVARHIALSFVYAIVPREDGGALDFTVARLRGERARVMECVLPMEDLISAENGVTRRAVRKKLGASVKFYDYSVTMGGEDLVLIFADGDGYAAIIIEPSREMREYLTSFAAHKNDILKGSDS